MKIEYKLIYSKQKIEDFIIKKQDWINKKQLQNKKLNIDNYKQNDSFLFLGKSYPIKIIANNNPISFDNNYFYLNSKDDIKAKFHWFYKQEFIKIALIKIKYYAQKYNFKYNKVRFKAQKTRWGSCSSKNNINLNYLLIMAPIPIIEMVIVHELVHTVHKNHSKNFYDLLQTIIPEYKKANTWLKQNQRLLMQFI